jgi:hypothetical protein
MLHEKDIAKRSEQWVWHYPGANTMSRTGEEGNG